MLNKIVYILGGDIKKLYFLFFILLVSIFLEVFTISSIIPIFDLIVNDSKDLLNFFDVSVVNQNNFKLFLVYGFFILYLLKTFIYTFTNVLVARISQTISRDLSKKMYEKYLFSNYSFLNNKNSSELIRNLTTEADNFFSYISNGCLILIDLLINLSLIIFLLYFNFAITISIFIFLIIFCSIYLLIVGDKMSLIGSDRVKYANLKINSINETFYFIKEIKIFLKEKLFFNNFNKFNNKLKNLNINFKVNSILPRPTVEATVIIIVGAMTSYSIKNQLPLTDIVLNLTVYMTAALKIFPSSANFIVRVNGIRFRTPSVNLVYRELKNLEKIRFNKSNINKMSFKKEISFQKISFGYTSKKIFNNLSLKLKKGKSYLLFSKNGSGKTTLLNILSGLLEISDGQIYLDKKLIEKKNFQDLKNLIGYVPQNVQLINKSLLFNITFEESYNKVNKVQLKKAIKYANLSKVIDSLPDKIHSNLGPNGNRISGGQRQKVAIARALYKSPKVLLFDEATSGIDVEGEQIVLDTILKLKKSFVILMVSHKIEHKKKFDYILSINKKKIDIRLPR